MEEQAVHNFETMLTQGRDNALLRFSLGNAYLERQNYSAAIEHFKKALELDANYSAAWKNYGKALAESHRWQEAVEIYQQGIAIAERKGDKQAEKEMRVFLKRAQKQVELLC